MKRRSFIKKTTLTGIALATIPNIIYGQHIISTEELIGKGNPKLFGKNHLLREEVHYAFQAMKTQALKAGIHIQIVSSYRNFEHQKRIWERKYNRFRNQGFSEENTIQKIIEYSTVPGTSRHHWGTDIDIIDANAIQPKYVLQEKHFQENGCFVNLKNWMNLHANSFGFYLVYTNNTNRKGFKHEPWHYSYKPLSQPFLQQFKSINLNTMLQAEKISGSSIFLDSFLNNYRNENILDINPKLL
ncbi:MAG: M15 family metallopeptidase [Oceanihabitans sp.]